MTNYLRREPRLDGNDLEAGLAELVKSDTPYERALPPMRIASTPATDIARLTSEAVLAQYEHAAKAVEEMGEAIKDSVAKLEASMAEHAADLKLITEAAAHIRAKGKLVEAMISDASALSKEVRDICAGFTQKNGG